MSRTNKINIIIYKRNRLMKAKTFFKKLLNFFIVNSLPFTYHMIIKKRIVILIMLVQQDFLSKPFKGLLIFLIYFVIIFIENEREEKIKIKWVKRFN